MVEIKPLDRFDPEAVQLAITGYVSSAKYALTKTETPTHTIIQAQLVQLDQPYVKRFEPMDEETIQRYTHIVAGGFSFGALDDERLVGLALAEPHKWNKSLWVWEFHISESHRGRGIGRQLMDLLAERARAAGLRTLVCETQNTNVPAITFYRQVGFSLDGIDLSYYTNDDVSSGEVALFMKRRLD